MQQFIEFIGNNLFWVSLWLALLTLLIWNLFGHVLQGVNQIEPMEAIRLINHEHAPVIDIRSPEDFANGHILNALNITEADLPGRKPEIEKMRKKPVIVYCQNGTASPRFVRLLKAQGLVVYSLRGGIATWQRAALPLTRSASQASPLTAA